MSIDSEIPAILPEGWFIYAMGEKVKPIIYKGDTHDHISFYADLQHRYGGRKTSGNGITLHAAFCEAVHNIEHFEGEEK